MKILCIVLLWCVSAILPATAGDVSTEAMITPLRLHIADEAVEVRDANGRLMQSLPCQGENPNEENYERFAFVDDLNFDGFPDVGILSSQGMYNLFYDCWLWNPGTGLFENYEELTDLPNLKTIPRDKKLVSCLHGCAVSHLMTEHVWESGQLEIVARTEQDYSEDEKTIIFRSYERENNGEMRLVLEKALNENNASSDTGQSKHGAADSLNLFPEALPDSARLVDGITHADGTWRLRHRLSDAQVFLDSRRSAYTEDGGKTIRDLIASEWPGARDVVVEPFDELAKKLTYPALGARFTMGENEDEHRFFATLVATDAWSFFFVLEAPADAAPLQADKNIPVDAAAQYAALEEDLKATLLSIAFMIPDTYGLFGISATPEPAAAPSCGDDWLEVRFVNLTSSAIRDIAVLWKPLEGGGRFARLDAGTAAGEQYRFAVQDASRLIGVSVDFENAAFVFDNVSPLGKRQKMALDITLDANDNPRLTLQENKDAMALSSGEYFHEWIDVKGELVRAAE